MTTNYPGGHQDNPVPYTPPSTAHITPGYFSQATPPPTFDVVPVQEAAAPSFPQGLVAPQRGNIAGPVAAIKSFFKQYAVFSGRSTRSEFWWVQLFHFVVLMVVSVLFGAIDGSGASALAGLIIVLYGLYMLAIIVPSLALFVRRLHDANMSGGFLALGLIPYAGALVVWILACLPSNPQGARFDKMPYLLPPTQPQGNYQQGNHPYQDR
ncbi:DUF805 domain-containing protein [Specibacter sp. NPDC078709]|uniref:DUF805 domain-containing protein n=1 Tax=Specibacter sp. NPDC078709 TaxID=3154364 RepID=UPI003419A4AB